jgi:cytochrome d ubiquinol oxidase subunit II
MDLQTVWFILVAVLWIGYFVLDGFDLGVGMLLPVLGKDDLRRRPRAATPHCRPTPWRSS